MEEQIQKRILTAKLPAHLVCWLEKSAKENYRSMTRELQRCLEECMKNAKA